MLLLLLLLLVLLPLLLLLPLLPLLPLLLLLLLLLLCTPALLHAPLHQRLACMHLSSAECTSHPHKVERFRK